MPGAAAPVDSRAASPTMGSMFDEAFLSRPVLEAVQQIKPLAASVGLTLAQFSLAWVLREINVASAIIGASRLEQVDENVAASEAVVDPNLIDQAEKIIQAAMAS